MTHQNTKPFKLVTRILQGGVVAGICVLVWIYKAAPPQTTQSSEPAAVEPVAPPDPAAAPAPDPIAASALEKQWGIRVSGLSLTNGDSTVLLRYTVVAPEKTVLLAETNRMAYLVNQAGGQKLPMIAPPQDGSVPQGASARTIGRMMRQAGQFPPASSRLIAGRTYLLQIPNWGRSLQSGSKVSLVVGDFRQDDLTVE